MRAVPVVVDHTRLRGEVRAPDDGSGEIGVARVVAGVEDRDLDPGAVESRGPRAGDVRLLQGSGDVEGVDTSVEPDVLNPVEQVAGEAAGPGSRDLGPERARPLLVRVVDGIAKLWEHPRPLRAGELGAPGAHRCGGTFAEVHDDRQRRPALVVIAVGDQAVHVEESKVEPLRGEQARPRFAARRTGGRASG